MNEIQKRGPGHYEIGDWVVRRSDDRPASRQWKAEQSGCKPLFAETRTEIIRKIEFEEKS